VDKQRRTLKFRQVLRPKLLWLSWRMQWVRKQQQTIDQPRFLRAQHGCLPPTVGLSPEENAASQQPPKNPHRILQALPVTIGIARPWRTVGPGLSKRQIAPQHRKPCLRKSLRQGDQ
jgi:hypothetical protein